MPARRFGRASGLRPAYFLLSAFGVVLVAAPVLPLEVPLVLPLGDVDDGVLDEPVAGGVDPVVEDDVLPVDGVDGLLMLPLVDGDAVDGGVLLGVVGADVEVDDEGVEEDGEGLDVSLLLQPYTVVSAATVNAIEIGLRIICETYPLI